MGVRMSLAVFFMVAGIFFLRATVERAMLWTLETITHSTTRARTPSAEATATLVGGLQKQLVACQQYIPPAERPATEESTDRRFQRLEAQVIGEPPDGLFGRLILNRGSRDGVTAGQAVVTADGRYIGRMLDTRERTAIMVYGGSELHKVTVRIANASRALGSTRGQGLAGLLVEYLDQHAALEHGALVVTSEREEHIPAGLVVGTVDRFEHDSTGLFQQATVIPAVSYESIERVVILIDRNAL